MNLLPFYASQQELDQAIMENMELEENVAIVDSRIIAFKVELGELANEIRFFKYWSQKPMSDRETILEEWVDCFHFLLSIGNYRKYNRFVNLVEIVKDENVTYKQLFFELFSNQLDCTASFRKALMCLFAIAGLLDFTEDDIRKMYYHKNAKNHKRQESGY